MEPSGGKGSKVHLAVDTLGNLLALYVTPANEQDRDQIGPVLDEIQAVTGESVEVAFVDQGVHRFDPGRRGREARHSAGSGQADRGQTRACVAPSATGGGAELWLGEPVPAIGARLRTRA